MSRKNCASPPLLISTLCIKGYVYLSDAELILLTSLRVWRGLKSLPVKAVELHCFQRTILFFFLLERQEKKEQINQLKAAIFTNLRGSKDSHVDFKIRATNLSISGTSSVMLPRFLRFI